MENQTNVNEIYNFIMDLTLKCGVTFKEGFYGNKEVEMKDGKFYDIVTEYDTRIEDMFINGILDKYPNHKFIGEETSAKNKFTPELTDDPTWIIDPIDGTANFVHSIPITCISVAFVLNKEIKIGIIYNPISNEMFTAKKGEGAFLNGTRIIVAKTTDIEKSIIGHEISLAAAVAIREKNICRLRAVVSRAQGIRSIGCAAMALAYTAQGQFDGYHIDDLWPWDVAAGSLLIREAGGAVYAPDGGVFDVMKANIVVAATEELCRQLIDLIKCHN